MKDYWFFLWYRPPEVKLLKKGDGYVYARSFSPLCKITTVSIYAACSTHDALSSVFLLRGTSGLEVKLLDKTVSKSNIETLIPGSVGSHGSSSESEYSEEEEQGFVSSVVAGRQRHVHWGDLPRRDTENQTQAGESRVSSTRLEREKSSHEVSKVSGPVTDFVSVDETSQLLQEVDLSDTSRAVSDQNSLQTSLNISQVGMSKKTAAGLRNLLKSHGKAKAEAPAVNVSILGALTHTMMEWRTEETMR